MAKKITQLTEATTADGTELLEIVQANLSKQITAKLLIMALAGEANGLASLDANGKLPSSQLPPLAINEVYPVDSEAEMLALTAERGDVAVRSDLNDGNGAAFVLNADDASVLANWVELPGNQGVMSVNTKTGPNVVLEPSDIGAATAAQGAAADAALPAAQKGAADGVATLDDDGLVTITERRRKVSDLGSVTGTVTIDLATADIFTMTLTGNVTFAFSNLPAAGLEAEAVLRLTQDATGGWAASWPAGMEWPGGYAYVGASVAGVKDEVGVVVDSAGAAQGYPVEGWA